MIKLKILVNTGKIVQYLVRTYRNNSLKRPFQKVDLNKVYNIKFTDLKSKILINTVNISNKTLDFIQVAVVQDSI